MKMPSQRTLKRRLLNLTLELKASIESRTTGFLSRAVEIEFRLVRLNGFMARYPDAN